MDQHTYEKRLGTICDVVGLSSQASTNASPVVVLTAGGSPERIVSMLKNQTFEVETVLVIDVGAESSSFVKRICGFGFNAQVVDPSKLVERLRSDFKECNVFFMSSKDYYGPNYLKDAIASLKYTALEVTGMSSFFSLDSNSVLNFDEKYGPEHMICHCVLGSTLIAKSRFVDAKMMQQFISGAFVTLEAPCYARARYEFARCLTGDDPPKAALDKIVLD